MSAAVECIRGGVLPVEGWTPPAGSAAVFRYVDISSVDRECKVVTGATELPVADAPSRARQLLRADDVLVSTVRPNLNAVAIVPSALDGAVGSTGFTVLRADRRRLLPRFLFHWVRTPMFVADMVKKATGASYPAVSDRIVLDSSMPMPDVGEQCRISDILDKADAVCRKRRHAVIITEELLRSAFLEMFGDPVTNPKGWEVKPLGTLLALPLRNGLSPASGGAHAGKVLTLSAITRGRFDETAVKQALFAAEPWSDVRLDERDFLICRGNGNLAMVGTGAFPRSSDTSVVFPDTMIAARVDAGRVSRAFLTTVWKSQRVRQQIEAGARTTNGTFKVNQTLVESVSIPVPALRQQRAFEVVAAQISKVSEKLMRGTQDAGTLFDSLVDRAFRRQHTGKEAEDAELGLVQRDGR